MSALWFSPLLLPALLLLTRLAPGRPLADEPWRWRVDLPLAVGLAVGLGTAWGFWFARFHLLGEALTAADYQAYCASVHALRDPDVHYWYPMRSMASGWLPGLLARRLGILDGLAAGALLSAMALAGGLYLWARALHGRLAGIAAALCGGAVAPLALTTRLASFYPEIAAALTLCAAGGALALRYRGWVAIAAGSSGAALALLADTRGLVFALPTLGLTAIAVALPPRRGRGARIAALLLPLALSFVVGRVAYAPTAPLEFQLATSANDTSGANEVMPELGPDEGFRWGHSNPLAIPWTLARVWKASRAVERDFADRAVGERNEEGKQRQVRPWLPVAWVALALALGALVRRPWLALALLGTALPFAVTLRGTTHWEVTVRYLALALPVVPVLVGVAVGLLVQGPLPAHGAAGEDANDASGRARLRALLRPAIAIALLSALLTGVLPSWLSPAATWRTPFETTPEALQTSRFVATGREPPPVPLDDVCLEGLGRDLDAGIPAESRLYGGP